MTITMMRCHLSQKEVTTGSLCRTILEEVPRSGVGSIIVSERLTCTGGCLGTAGGSRVIPRGNAH